MAKKAYYILTGPPSSGKTALINYFQHLGYTCFDEMARAIIQENKKNNINCFPWNNIKEFSHQVFLRSVDLFVAEPSNSLCFLDRSIVDLVAYLDLAKIKRNPLYIKTIKDISYNKKVFFLPFWDKIYLNDNERIETKQQALLIEKHLLLVYRELGFDLVVVPKLKLEKRADFILKEIQ